MRRIHKINICRQCKSGFDTNEKTRKKVFCSRQCFRDGRKASGNPNWAGDGISYGGVHDWVKTQKVKPKACERCKIERTVELANIAPTYNPQTYTRDINNWEWLCRKCHMEKDGRLNQLSKLRSRDYIATSRADLNLHWLDH